MRDVILIMVLMFVVGTVFAIINFVGNTINTELVAVPEIAADSEAVSVFNSIGEVSNRLDYVAFLVFIGLALSLIITAWIVAGHTLFMFIYGVVVLIVVVMSAVVSNVWTAFADNVSISTAVANMPITNNLLTNFPIYMTVIGFIGMVILFAKPQE